MYTSKTRRGLAWLLAGVSLVASPATAHFGERTDSLWGFVSRSDLVVIGTVLESQHLEEKGHTTVPGAVRLKVEETIKGQAPDGDVGILIEGMHQPRYGDGERVLVFAEKRKGVFRSLQSRSEKITYRDKIDPAVEAVRRYAAICAEKDTTKRVAALEGLTLALLRDPTPRLHEDAVYDLNRPGLLDTSLDRDRVAALGRLALDEGTALVVREGIAAKLGALARGGRSEAVAPLERLAKAAALPAVRVAAVNGLAITRQAALAPALFAALEDQDAWVRLAAVEGLALLGASDGVARLAVRARDDSDPGVRLAAVKALFRIGNGEARAAIEEFASSAGPEDKKMVAQAAAQVLPHTAGEERKR